MTKEEKLQLVEDLTNEVRQYPGFYITDITNLNAQKTTELRKLCHERGITLRVVKNALIAKVLENLEITDKGIYDSLKGASSLLLHETVTTPAKLIKDTRKKLGRPLLKAAYVAESVYIGDDQVDALIAIKSKEELIGEIIGLLQSPMKNVISGLTSSAGGKIHALLETLSKKEE